jgi:CHASE1-domain containing sensor protein
MDAARDRGGPAASGRVTLVQERVSPDAVGGEQPGFLVYVPVYTGGAVPATVAARRRALAGFVYAPFRTGDLMRGIFGSEARPRVDFRVFDGADTAAALLLADSRALAGARRGRRGRARRPRAAARPSMSPAGAGHRLLASPAHARGATLATRRRGAGRRRLGVS